MVKKKARAAKKGGVERVRLDNTFPTTYKAKPVQVRSFRFEMENGTAVVYRQCLLSLLVSQSNSVSSTEASYPIQAIRLRRVKAWTLIDPASAHADLTLQFFSDRGPVREWTSVGNNVRPAHLSVVPPPDSLAGYWSQAGSQEGEKLFELQLDETGTSMGIVDIEVEYVLAEGSISYGTATTGTRSLMYAYLDCLNGAGAAGTALCPPYQLATSVVATRTGVSPSSLSGTHRKEHEREEPDSNPSPPSQEPVAQDDHRPAPYLCIGCAHAGGLSSTN